MFNDMTLLEAELDMQNAALEALLSDLDDMDIAEEGLFSKPKTAEQMLEKVKKTINKKCKTAEDCDDMLSKLTTEEEKFNSALSTMKDAATKFRDGEIDKKELKSIIKPAVKDLKKSCNMISLKDINDDTDNVTDEEIQKLHDFLTGARSAIEEKKASLGSASESYYYDDPYQTIADAAIEAYYIANENYLCAVEYDDIMIAEEGLKDALTTAKNAVCNFIKGLISKFSKKEKTEKDPKKKNILSKLIGKLKSIFSKANRAKDGGDLEECKAEAEEVSQEATDLMDEWEERLSGDKTFESYYAEESFFDLLRDTDFDIAEEGLKDVLQNLKDALIKKLQEWSRKCSDKSMKAKSAKAKRFWDNASNTFRNFANKAKSAKEKDDIEKINQEATAYNSGLSEEARALLRGEIDSARANENYANSDLYELMYENALEAYELAEENYYLALEGAKLDKVKNAGFAMVLRLASALGDPETQRIYRAKTGEAKKAIDKKIKEAKNAVKNGDSAKAISLYKEARKGYVGILSAIKKLPDVSMLSNEKGKDTRKSNKKAHAIDWANEQISKIDNAIEMIQGRDSYNSRRASEKEAKIQNRQARKDERAARKAAKREAVAEESFMDAMLDLDMAIEGLSTDADPLYGLEDLLY